MTRKVVLVHGRSQEGKDSAALKTEWLSYLEDGLKCAGLPVELADSQFRMPYYGDTLLKLTDGSSVEAAPRVIVRGAMNSDAGYRSFAEAFVRDIKDSPELAGIGMPPGGPIARGVLNWRWVQDCLRALDQRSSTVSDLTVSQFTKDVYAYLTNTAISEVMEMGVMEAIGDSSEPIIVSHSLGTVIAYNVLKKRPEIKVPLFVTLGSPLGIEAIKRRIAPIVYPGGVARWINAYDTRDVVSLFPLDSSNFLINSAIENDASVQNPTENRHGISGYLAHAPVAEAIFRTMTAS
jgi:hypothetical protein